MRIIKLQILIMEKGHFSPCTNNCVRTVRILHETEPKNFDKESTNFQQIACILISGSYSIFECIMEITMKEKNRRGKKTSIFDVLI